MLGIVRVALHVCIYIHIFVCVYAGSNKVSQLKIAREYHNVVGLQMKRNQVVRYITVLSVGAIKN